MKLKLQDFPNGLTVRELKKIVADWPEENVLGDLTTVWVDNSEGLSSEVRSVWPLNVRDKDEAISADIMFSPL